MALAGYKIRGCSKRQPEKLSLAGSQGPQTVINDNFKRILCVFLRVNLFVGSWVGAAAG